jgi:hypothetical protein
MALVSRTIEIPLVGGVDTKSDNKQIPPGKLFLLENARRLKNSKVQKRFGCAKMGDDIVGSSAHLANSDALGVVGDELLQFTGQSVYSYSENADRWSDKGAALSLRVKLQSLVNNNYEQTSVDQAISGNIGLIAWEDSRGGVRCSVYDHSSESQLLSDTVVHAAGEGVRCLAFEGNLYVFYSVGGNIRARQINPVNPSPLGGEVTLSVAGSASTVAFDVLAHNDYMNVVFNGSGTNLYFLRVNSALTVLSIANIGETAIGAITSIKGPGQTTLLVWSTGTTVRGAIYDLAGTQTVAPFIVESLSGVEAITGYELPDGTGVRLFYQVSAALSYNHYTKTAVVNAAGSVSGVAVFLRSVGIASKAFAYSPDTTDRGFLAVSHDSTLQGTYFIARNDGTIVGKIGYGLGGGLLSRPTPSSVYERETGVFSFSVLTKNPLISTDGGKFLSFKGVSLAELDFTAQSNYSSVELGENAHILGGIVQGYDGQGLVEHGFHLNPENASASQTTGGSLTLLGEYQYCVLYRWMDAKGKLHQSAPSTPLSITLTGGNNRVQLTIPTLRLTAKKSPRTNVEIVVYRTEAALEEFYRANSPTSLLYNDPTADTVNYTDDLSDATLATREPLYTAGGLLENDAPPSAAFGCPWKNRFGLGGTEDDTFWLSKEVVPGKPVEFSNALTFNLERKGGKSTGMAALLDKLILFKESAIYYIYGDGPDGLGVGQWSTPEQVSSDVGAVDSVSIADTPAGIVFKSRKGIYLLTGDLQLSYIGAEVEDWNDETVTAAVVMSDYNEVRFTTLSGPTLVYNYENATWAVWPNTSATDAAIWKNRYIYIRRTLNADSIVVRETPEQFKDVDQYYSMRVGIGWLSFAKLAGYQRIRRLMPVGTYKSAHTLRAKLAFDYSESYTEEHEWDAASYLGASTYGGSSPYGSEALYGGNDGPYIVRFHVAHQKNTALRCILEDTDLSGSGESFDLSALSLEVAGKKGLFKLPAEAKQ